MSNIQNLAVTGTTNLKSIFPGLLVAALVALAAQFLAEHYGAPAMLLALLLGIALHFLTEEGQCVEGVQFASSTLLRIGVALLGARISVELLSLLGMELIGLVVAGVFATMLFGLLGAKLLGRGWRLAILTGGAVAICGASAAIAIASVLPKNEYSERNLIFAILSVTVLSTVAMIAYPPLTETLGLDNLATGVFLGGTIHDVAQVVGAGYSISPETGDIATVVKLIRVAMLAPIVLVISVFARMAGDIDHDLGKKPPLVPVFVLGFLALATVNSLELIPEVVVDVLNDVSRWALLIAISAVGMKVSLRKVLDVGGQAIALIMAETIFIALFILFGLWYLAG
ncbi:MAG: putative sulfate exporter family transporter [Stappiaceae bacterium]